MLAFPPDFTFVIQLASFFLLLFVLNGLLFVPFQELLAERAARTTGDEDEADAHRAEAEELAAKVEAEMAAARSEAMAEVDAVRRETKSKENELLATAQQTAAERLTALRAEIADARSEAEGVLKADSEAMANEMVEAILGTRGTA